MNTSGPYPFPEIALLKAPRYSDRRGVFVELASAAALAEAGVRDTFCQDNLSQSLVSGTVRGLHFQRPPYTQAKFITVAQGSVFDVVVDVRWGSPTFGQSWTYQLDAEKGDQIFIPEGFAHGFSTLVPDTIVFYKVSRPYSREHEAGIHWQDSDLDISWPVSSNEAVLSEKDMNLPQLRSLSCDALPKCPDRA